MLNHLQIKNYALIAQLEIWPDARFNIITGETGAGKSIMLGAIGLLLGNRADGKSLYNPDEKCVIEGHFNVSGYVLSHIFEEEELDYDTTCIVRREISPQGKSRAFVNDTPVNLETLRRITSQLMDIHSQHDTLLLGTNEYALQLVDTFAQNEKILHAYRSDYQEFVILQKKYHQLQNEAKASQKEFDYNVFLLDELNKSKLQATELEALERELAVLENAEEVREKLQLASEYLNAPEQGMLSALRSVLSALQGIAQFSEVLGSLRERTNSVLIELKDLAAEIESEAESVELDEGKITQIQERLDLIYRLLQKHQVKSVAELLAIQADLSAKVGQVLNMDETLAKAQADLAKAEKRMLVSAEALSESRKSVLRAMEQQVSALLVELGMPNASLQVEHSPTKPAPEGADGVTFLFSANKGIRPQPLKQVASGGEFSRLMMALKYLLATKRKLPTIIFDEIDTGVSGEISIKMGQMMRDMSQSHQVIAITHLHQIAAQGASHYFVYKDNSAARTVSKIKKLEPEERVMEIAQMIGGQRPSPAVINNAREILGMS
jgi:DNA repair protein RecN (Recombination protein N)